MSSRSTSSLTVASSSPMAAIRSRRTGSDRAANTSLVVGVLAIAEHHIPFSEYVNARVASMSSALVRVVASIERGTHGTSHRHYLLEPPAPHAPRHRRCAGGASQRARRPRRRGWPLPAHLLPGRGQPDSGAG